ncbi:MAG TPA: GntR family transcriptional regulator [Candidatus Aminicenantes bacterium]|nr:GntR family transcriptional regulator [Candidatus Aminicenantes bacterium]HRY63828.1 GntR family transcriptional regulator [Candidatus Aminicenantes bacterium]HRZ70741.1 GntR family transcriptional regulator [Candidatus Aminicenantes bacterium]
MMDRQPILNVKSLKEQVYEYLRDQMRHGQILPGSAIDMGETSKKLGVSKTPLRDALLQLEMEGFVTILPRRMIVVNTLSGHDIRDYYEIIGPLESMALLKAFERMKPADIDRMEALNRDMAASLEKNDFDAYYEKNLAFHNTFLDLCGNDSLVKIVNNLKKRLYDFPRVAGFVKEWEEASIGEHQTVVDLLRQGRSGDAANHVRDVHWSFEVQERFIRLYYPAIDEKAG